MAFSFCLSNESISRAGASQKPSALITILKWNKTRRKCLKNGKNTTFQYKYGKYFSKYFVFRNIYVIFVAVFRITQTWIKEYW